MKGTQPSPPSLPVEATAWARINDPQGQYTAGAPENRPEDPARVYNDLAYSYNEPANVVPASEHFESGANARLILATMARKGAARWKSWKAHTRAP